MASKFNSIDIVQFLIDSKKIKEACTERRSQMFDPCSDCPLSKSGGCRYLHGRPTLWELPDMMISADDKSFLDALKGNYIIRRSSDGSLAMFDGDYQMQLNAGMFEMIDRGKDYTTDQLKKLDVIGANKDENSGVYKWLRGLNF